MKDDADFRISGLGNGCTVLMHESAFLKESYNGYRYR